jgi:hypothetical protein
MPRHQLWVATPVEGSAKGATNGLLLLAPMMCLPKLKARRSNLLGRHARHRFRRNRLVQGSPASLPTAPEPLRILKWATQIAWLASRVFFAPVFAPARTMAGRKPGPPGCNPDEPAGGANQRGR